MRKVFLIIFLLIPLFVAISQEQSRKSYTIQQTLNAPVIDGMLNDEAWTLGKWEGSFTQHEPYEGRLPSQQTEFNVLCDNDFIYVGFKAFDTAPDSIIDRMTRRDDMDGDNVGIAFDSYFDRSTAFAFFVSSSGVKTDLIFINDGNSEDATWDPIWYVKTARFSDGWSAEMKIPLSQLRFNSEGSDVWGLEVSRHLARHNELSLWQPIPRNSHGFIHLIGDLEGVSVIKARKQADLTPYFVANYKRYQQESGNPFSSGKDFNVNTGLDGKFGLTNNFTLDLTVFPDFGQVEADPSEVNLTAYETFFQEKRPFFIEGRNITSFKVGIGDGDLGNDNLFYSRRIGRRPQIDVSLGDGEYADIPRQTRILGAVKMTGKTSNGFSLGVIEAVTAEEKAEIDLQGSTHQQIVEPLTNYLITRVQKDFDNGNTMIGGALTNTWRNLDETTMSSLHKSAYTGGIDFSHYWDNKTWMLSLTESFSKVNGSASAIATTQRSSVHYFQRPGVSYLNFDTTRTSLSGHAGNLQIGKVGGNWNFVWFNIWKSPGFESNDVGYVRRVDEYAQVLWSAYSINEPFGIFNYVRFNTNHWMFWDFGGNFNGAGGNFGVSAKYKNQWSSNVYYNYDGASNSNNLLRGGSAIKVPGAHGFSVSVGTDSRKKFMTSFYTNYNAGNYGSSQYKSYGAEIKYRPINSLSVSASPGYSIMNNHLQYMEQVSYGEESRFIFGTIHQEVLSFSLRINYNLTPDLSIQYWSQPFFAAGDYQAIKMITNPQSNKFEKRFHVYDKSQISFDNSDNVYKVDENRDGLIDYQVELPDFNSHAFLSNLVMRWEFIPGSTLFLVWSQNRDYFSHDGELNFSDNFKDLFNHKRPFDIFLIKLSYRIGLS